MKHLFPYPDEKITGDSKKTTKQTRSGSGVVQGRTVKPNSQGEWGSESYVGRELVTFRGSTKH